MTGRQRGRVSDEHAGPQVEESGPISVSDPEEDCVGPSWHTCPRWNPTLCSGMVRNNSQVRSSLMPMLLEGQPDRR